MRTQTDLPLLTAAQEIELARRVHGADQTDALAARDELVLHNMGLVGMIAGYYARHWRKLDYDDLCSEATIALVHVAGRYDPDTHHTRFATYAVIDIKGRLRNFVKARRPASWPLRDERVDPAPPALERIITSEEIGIAVAEMNELEPMKAYIIARRFGVGEPQASTLEEIARELGCTRQYINQIATKALDQLAYRSRSANRRSIRNIAT